MPVSSPSVASAAVINAHGSVEQIYVTGADPGELLRLVRRGRRVATDTAGSLGGALFRRLKPGKGYRVRSADGDVSAKLAVMSDRSAPRRRGVFAQTLPAGGYGYLTTRDGTKLAINVHLPGPASGGPYPTLIEYSGYGYADPDGPESGISAVGNLLGFAVVDVNMRGTGCSGGAFDYFEELQALDGYDVIETVSRQPWVAPKKVGMMGISYGGISQLFVGATRPPHLAAITPLSVIDNSATTLYPGGILNTGFALQWAMDRVEDAEPASPTGGQPWAYEQIQNGDATCAANQTLHTEAVNVVQKTYANSFYRPRIADPVSPVKFVNKINVPVFLACQFNDEQTGGHCPRLVRHFTGTKRKWFTFTNGLHIDSLDPATFNRWYDFLSLFVARRAPNLSPPVKNLAPSIYQTAMGIPNITLPSDPLQGKATFKAALRAFLKLKRVRILFDNGAGRNPGEPYAAFERSFSRLPIKSTRARSFFFAENGLLARKAPRKPGSDTFTWDKSARPPTNFTGDTSSGDLWTAFPNFQWLPNPPGSAASYITPTLKRTTAIIGAGAVEAFIHSSARDIDLQVTVTEVRPDGKETYVQSGWLRASKRKLDPRTSTLLEPNPSLRRRDARLLPAKGFAKVTIPLYYQGHVYRAGSRIRVAITAPSGDQPVWAFANTVPSGTANVTIAFSRRRPSRLILPFIPGVGAPTGLPPCPSLRGEPCRNYVP